MNRAEVMLDPVQLRLNMDGVSDWSLSNTLKMGPLRLRRVEHTKKEGAIIIDCSHRKDSFGLGLTPVDLFVTPLEQDHTPQ